MLLVILFSFCVCECFWRQRESEREQGKEFVSLFVDYGKYSKWNEMCPLCKKKRINPMFFFAKFGLQTFTDRKMHWGRKGLSVCWLTKKKKRLCKILQNNLFSHFSQKTFVLNVSCDGNVLCVKKFCNYSEFHGFRLLFESQLSWVNFDHFWSMLHFLRHLGQ